MTRPRQSPTTSRLAIAISALLLLTAPSVHCSIIQSAASFRHFAVLFGNGTVHAWSVEPWVNAAAAVPPNLKDVKQIATSYYATLCLLENGTVVGFGDNLGGVLDVPRDLGAVRKIAAGYAFVTALMEDGSLRSWGLDQTRNDSFGSNGEIPVPPVRDVKDIATGSGHSLALLENGTVVGFGADGGEQVSGPSGLSDVARIGASDAGSAVIFENGTVKMWGNGAVQVPPFEAGEVVEIDGGSDAFLVVLRNGSVRSLGRGYILSDLAVPDYSPRTVQSISVGDHTVMAVLDDGSLRMWGRYEVPAELVGEGGATPASVTATPTTLSSVASNTGAATSTASILQTSLISKPNGGSQVRSFAGFVWAFVISLGLLFVH